MAHIRLEILYFAIKSSDIMTSQIVTTCTVLVLACTEVQSTHGCLYRRWSETYC